MSDTSFTPDQMEQLFSYLDRKQPSDNPHIKDLRSLGQMDRLHVVAAICERIACPVQVVSARFDIPNFDLPYKTAGILVGPEHQVRGGLGERGWDAIVSTQHSLNDALMEEAMESMTLDLPRKQGRAYLQQHEKSQQLLQLADGIQAHLQARHLEEDTPAGSAVTRRRTL